MRKSIPLFALTVPLLYAFGAEEMSAVPSNADEKPAIQVPSAEPKPTTEIHPSAYFYMDGAFINEMQDFKGERFKGEPMGVVTGGIVLTGHPSDILALTVNPELRSYNMVPARPRIAGGESKQGQRWQLYLQEAKAAWTFGNAERPNFVSELGFIAYQDNPDTKIFGNYLFRSMIYPAIIFTKLADQRETMLGYRLQNNLGSSFTHNLFVQSETRSYPFWDISLAYTADYSLGNILEVGAGFKLQSAIPLRPSKTTPDVTTNRFHQVAANNKQFYIKDRNDFDSLDQAGKVIKVLGTITDSVTVSYVSGLNVTLITSSSKVDTVKGNGVRGLEQTDNASDFFKEKAFLLNADGSTPVGISDKMTKYTFKGAILMARIALNPLGNMEQNPLGKDALKIYSEVSVLGYKNYDGFYEKRSERMPIMFGLNLATFDMVDYLTVEAEYFKNSQAPSYETRFTFNVPVPGGADILTKKFADPKVAKRDDFKWAVEAKKSYKGCGFIVHVGQDHLKHGLQGSSETEFFQTTELLSNPAQWYAEMRFFAGFQ